jgi:hypothetical protein
MQHPHSYTDAYRHRDTDSCSIVEPNEPNRYQYADAVSRTHDHAKPDWNHDPGANTHSDAAAVSYPGLSIRDAPIDSEFDAVAGFQLYAHSEPFPDGPSGSGGHRLS